MSLASVHPVDISASQERLTPCRTSSSSLDEMQLLQQHPGEAMLTLESLRVQINSCFTCGVCWADDHVSLDCQECGGYALTRPCPLCNGHCGHTWDRDGPMTHTFRKARWLGTCSLSENPLSVQTYPAMRAPLPTASAMSSHSLHNHQCSAAARLAQDLCQRLERLAQERQT